jgi:hypothetical protein
MMLVSKQSSTLARRCWLVSSVSVPLGTFWLNSRVYRITACTLQVTERGQVTDRYSKAIEQLGSATLDVRLGGIYALEQIVRESDRGEEDQATIVEVLSAFVRVHSDPLFQYKTSLGKAAPSGPADEQVRKAVQYAATLGGPPVDVQAAVSVLGRLSARVGTTLNRADLTRAALRKANLSGANLTGANLYCADLTNAVLVGVNLTEATLFEADLTGANLRRADLTSAVFVDVNLTRPTSRGKPDRGQGLGSKPARRCERRRNHPVASGLRRPERWRSGGASEPG